MVARRCRRRCGSARILNGFSPLISRRSAISRRMRAIATVIQAADLRSRCGSRAVRAPPAGERRGDRRPRVEAGRSRRGSRRRPRRRPWPPSRRPPCARAMRSSIVGVVTPGASRLRLSHSIAICRPTSSQSPRCERRAHRDRRVADPLEAVEDVPVAVDVALGDLPVVRARVSRRAGVGEHDALLELARIDVERRRAMMPSTRELDRRRRRRRAPAGSPARRSARGSSGTRRSSPPAAGARDRDDGVRSSAPARRSRRWSAPTIRRCRRRPAIRRASSASRSRAGSGAPAARAARARRCRPARTNGRRATVRSVSIDRSSTAAVRARFDLDVRAQADRRVQRRRAVVEEIQRPDVDGAAGQIDACRRGRRELHVAIIAITPRRPSAGPQPEWRSGRGSR